MGKVVYHWDDLKHSAFDNSPLRLAAIAGTDSFYYCISDRTNGPCAAKGFQADRKFHFFDKPLGYLAKLIGEDDLLYADFEKVQIAIRGIPFVALPAELAGGHAMRQRLAEVTEISASDEVYCDTTDEGFAIAFAVSRAFANEALAWFSNASISHAITALITCALRHSREGSESLVHLNISHDLLEMVVCRPGQLLFANHYRISGSEDVLYYVLAILKQTEISTEQVTLYCSGTEAQSALPELKAYLPRVELYSFPDVNPRSDYPAVDTVDLICVSKCVS